MRGRKESRRGRNHAAANRQRDTRRKLRPGLHQEELEERLALSGTGFEGNPCAPDLDLSGLGTQSAVVGEQFTLDLFASGAYVEDLDGDGNASGDTIRLQLDPDDNPTGATLTSDGILRWTPTSDQMGLQEFVVLAVDEGTPPLADAEVFTIEVFAGNDAPNLAEIADTGATAGQELEVTVTATDPDGDNLTFVLDRDDPDSTVPDGATLTQSDNGTAPITWTPTENDAAGDYVFSVLVIDDGSPVLSDREVFTVTLSRSEVENTAPEATADAYSVVVSNQLVASEATGVLQNDSDDDSDALTAVLKTDVEHGSLTLNSDGSFTYTPESSYAGSDSFSYVANDGSSDSNEVTVTISVVSETNAPVAENDQYEIVEGSTLEIDVDSGVLANDSDGDGDTLSGQLESGPSNGTLTFNSDGSFTYVPDTGFYGSDSFIYTANDATQTSNTATVTITVQENQAPTGLADEYSVITGAELDVSAEDGVLANDTDDDGQTLTASILAAPVYGTLVFQSDGSFVYTPTSGYSGTDSFEYAVHDGIDASSSVTVVITVRENHAPVSGTEQYSVTEDEELMVNAASGILANDTDEDGDALSISLLTGPFHGTLLLDEDGSFTYTPNAGYSGADLFTYEVSDGILSSGSTTVNLTVVAVNDAPVAYGDCYWVATNDTLAPDSTIGVIANDYDVDEDTLSVSIVTGPANGTLTLESDGSFSYTPGTDYVGVDSFIYELSDGSETAQAEVTLQVGTDFGPVVISEFTASGNETYPDSNGEYYDWIEIHSLSDEDVNLANWALTDDASDLSMWVFPSVTLEAGGYLVVFASGDNQTDPSAELHTNFKLSADGEYLALVNAEGDVTSEFSPDYPESRDGVAYGFDSTATPQYFATPTPGEPNTAETIQFVGEVVASADSGYYYESFTVTLTVESSEATIRYTTDGSEPTATTGTVYTEPIEINETTVLQAVAFQDGFITEDPSLYNYVILEGGLVLTEINYNPSEPTEAELLVDGDFEADDFEFVELTNVSDAAIDLSGLQFSNGIEFDFGNAGISSLSSGETVLLVSNQAAFEARYGSELNVVGVFGGKLSNKGETLEIVDAVDEVILECSYDDEDGWPTEADGGGYTLELIALGDPNDSDNWDIGDEGGSPGNVPSWDSLVTAALGDDTV